MSPAFCHPEDLADHDRDLRKHEPRPSEPYFACAYSTEPGRAPEPRPIDQRAAVAKLVGYCEGICKSGALTEISEAQLRRLVIETLIAFEMPTKAERAHDLIKHEPDGSIRLVPS